MMLTLFHLSVIPRPDGDQTEGGPQEYVLLFLPGQSEEEAMCTLNVDSEGRWEGQVYRSGGEHFGTLSEDVALTSPAGRVFTLFPERLGFRSGTLSAQGEPAQRRARVFLGGLVVATADGCLSGPFGEPT